MKKTLALLALEFFAITAPLTGWWMLGGQQLYFKFYMHLARPILALLGVTGFPPSAVRDRFINFLPFLALMIVTPRISMLRRFSGIVGGYLLIFVGQIGLTYWAFVCFVRDGRTEASMAHFFPALVLSDALPFVLWALLANRFITELMAYVLPKRGPGH